MKWAIFYITLFCFLFSKQRILAYDFQLHNPSSSQFFSLISNHPVHISFTNIEFNAKSKKFEILFKLFIDDFTQILNTKYKQNFDLIDNKQMKANVEGINKYILEHFKLVINGRDKTKSDLKFINMEVRELSIWLHYEFNFSGNSNTFDIQNSLMTDLYHDQTNLLIFTFNNEQKAIKFSYNKTNEKLTF
jgi:hypothetical protein